jgi:hypothetical protein
MTCCDICLQIVPFAANREYAFPHGPTAISEAQRRTCSAMAAMALEKLLHSAMAGPEGMWSELAADIVQHRDGLVLHLLSWLLVVFAAEQGARMRTLCIDVRESCPSLLPPIPMRRAPAPSSLPLYAAVKQSFQIAVHRRCGPGIARCVPLFFCVTKSIPPIGAVRVHIPLFSACRPTAPGHGTRHMRIVVRVWAAQDLQTSARPAQTSADAAQSACCD